MPDNEHSLAAEAMKEADYDPTFKGARAKTRHETPVLIRLQKADADVLDAFIRNYGLRVTNAHRGIALRAFIRPMLDKLREDQKNGQ